MKRIAIALSALALAGCASAYPVGDAYTADLREAGVPDRQPNPIFMALAAFLIETNPNRTETTVWLGRERHTVTTTVSRDGRTGTVRVSP